MSFLVFYLKKIFARRASVVQQPGLYYLSILIYSIILNGASTGAVKYGRLPAQAKSQAKVASPVPSFLSLSNCGYFCKSSDTLSRHYKMKHPRIFKENHHCHICGAYFLTESRKRPLA
ncbi:zinc finger protein, partial [Striga asiatica]